MIEFKEKALRQYSDLLIVTLLTIVVNDKSFYYVNDNKDLKIKDKVFKAKGFSHKGFNPSAEDSTASIELDGNLDDLTKELQKATSAYIILSAVDIKNTSFFVDGPYTFNLTGFTKIKNLITLNLKRKGRLDYSLSTFTYSSALFPGLYG